MAWICFLVAAFPLQSQEHSAQEVADKLSNPVANLISLPIQNNVDYGIGPNNGSKYTINIQPVFPLSFSKKINLIIRLILPIVDQRDITGDHTREFGLSDATLTAFFAPKATKGGLIWAAGPAFLIPTGTDDHLSTRKWAIGPSALALLQRSGLTFGFLTNQLWSFAGDDSRADVNQLFFQPFFSKSWKSGASMGINSEMTLNWEAGTTTASLNPIVSGVTKLGNQMVSLTVGPRIPIAGPESSRPDWGFRGVLTFVFPK